ncbi:MULTISPECIES: peptide-methionine (S)-S-oxide reductase MsrA [unclassified Rhizobium]|uniref:peptide-methionine (S)-S-oxide reductase MsrA n=1 Tax=unclassified Rhizobium TaxID=2613769 RepID=UPI00071394F1|nr:MULTISPECIES: peptide-methionine (S)-S-oxide reductase MsrA [unclassified Rhizobium]KQS97810.1 methionine sulfoxide reductase A [Rhizobium sp. Leaf386]KQT00068.1 methionine sulfoxide reductase A [Rhizobium sp. Leaf391]KQT97073.1 methionine sulfoxide reductase A [Rhizobium sp. Leaf453]
MPALTTIRSSAGRRLGLLAGAAALAVVTFGLSSTFGNAAEEAVVIPPPAVDEAATATTEKAVFAGGCFWGVQGVFQHVKGVKNAVSGYSGGTKDTAVYETVSGGNTGHAEAVEITYNPQMVTYGQLLQIYFSVAHNPTQLNYQGPDHGTQYRSEVFAVNGEQKKIAQSYIAQLDKAKVYGEPVVTKVSDITEFYPAEDYHQDFLTLNPTYPYIVYNDMPKIENLKALFPTKFSSEPVLVMKAKG